MTLEALENALLELGVPVFHYFAFGQTGNYIVWTEDSEGQSLHADNVKTGQVIQGTIDYFTKTENDPLVKQIQDKLNEVEISWRLNDIFREDDTGYIHYEWVFEVI